MWKSVYLWRRDPIFLVCVSSGNCFLVGDIEHRNDAEVRMCRRIEQYDTFLFSRSFLRILVQWQSFVQPASGSAYAMNRPRVNTAQTPNPTPHSRLLESRRNGVCPILRSAFRCIVHLRQFHSTAIDSWARLSTATIGHSSRRKPRNGGKPRQGANLAQPYR
jgi:hypothetical protein